MFIVARTAEAGAEKTEPAFLCIDAITGLRASEKSRCADGQNTGICSSSQQFRSPRREIGSGLLIMTFVLPHF
ncbi:MAG TPA: hypothetical protein VFE89_10835 [Beijerinckiaceae bacterium]|jgi:hypothetical protein|nr:hypothetical protein [Beijerinckiaceae bacterium]